VWVWRGVRLRGAQVIGPANFAAWVQATAASWSNAAQSAWDGAVATYRSAVEADRKAAEQRAYRMADVLWGPKGAYERLKAYQSWAGQQDAAVVIDLQARAAGAAKVAPEVFHPSAFQRRLDEHASGLLRDSSVDPNVGVAPLLVVVPAVAALVFSVPALCWAWVRSKEADGELARLELIERLGASYYEAAEKNPSVESPFGALTKDPKPDADGGWGGVIIPAVVGISALAALGFVASKLVKS
jgi:hypothetical protein